MNRTARQLPQQLHNLNSRASIRSPATGLLLAVDAGNTQTHLGLFDGKDLIAEWRTSTDPGRTSDDLAMVFKQFLSFREIAPEQVSGAVVGSVVPSLTSALETMINEHFGIQTIVVGPRVKSGMPILTENPKEVGADRVVNSIAALDLFGGPLIVVDFGTATTFDVISEAGQYMGGVICPGVGVSASALWSAAAQLSRVELRSPSSVIGRSTVESVRSGVVLGAAAMVEGMVERIEKELGFSVRLVATGGLASLVLRHTELSIQHVAELTLTGLRILYERNVD